MKISKYIGVFILVLIGIIVFQRISIRKSNKIIFLHTVDTIYQRYDSLIYIPKEFLVYRDTGSLKLVKVHDTISIPLPTDTLAILVDYSRKRVSNDTILKDSNILVIVIDTIQYNRQKSRQKIIHYYIIHKQETLKLHNKVYLGLGVGGGIDNFGFSGKVLFQNKRQQIFGLSYNPINHYWEVSTFWLLRLKKNK